MALGLYGNGKDVIQRWLIQNVHILRKEWEMVQNKKNEKLNVSTCKSYIICAVKAVKLSKIIATIAHHTTRYNQVLRKSTHRFYIIVW